MVIIEHQPQACYESQLNALCTALAWVSLIAGLEYGLKVLKGSFQDSSGSVQFDSFRAWHVLTQVVRHCQVALITEVHIWTFTIDTAVRCITPQLPNHIP